MKKEKKFTLEKFEVAKLKNLKKIIGGDVTNDGGTVFTTTDLTTVNRDGSNGNC